MVSSYICDEKGLGIFLENCDKTGSHVGLIVLQSCEQCWIIFLSKTQGF